MKKRNQYLLNIKKLEKKMPSAEEKTADEYLCADGKAQIDINLYDGAELFHPFTFGKQRDLNSEIYELIDAKLYTIPLKYPVRLCFHGNIPDMQTQKEISDVIQEHYMFAFRDKKEDLQINMIKAVCMTVFGLALLAAYFTLELISSSPVFLEFLSIVGCFAIWEAVDTWILQRKTLKIDYLNAGQAVLSEVVFAEESLPH